MFERLRTLTSAPEPQDRQAPPSAEVAANDPDPHLPPTPSITPRLALSPVAPQQVPFLGLTPMPQLTGVVQGPVGNSGWQLGAITSSGEVISQQGQQRSLSVGGLF